MSASESPGTRENAGVVAPPPLIYLGGLVVGLRLDRWLSSGPFGGRATRTLGAALALGGLLLMREFFMTFRRAGTAIDPRRPATTLVTDGPYRFTRNPAYLGMALLYSGITLRRRALWPFLTLLVVLGIIDRGVIAREERYLVERFGEPYAEYCTRVRRWL